MIGARLSHFRILSKIGEGGMGEVYAAEDEKLGRRVALKVLHRKWVNDEERRLRFLREARAAAAVTHPHIATIHEVDEADGVVFIAMELIEGRTLGSLIQGRPLSLRDALRIAIEIGEALSRAHGAGVVHRDLKPDNVIVGGDGHAKILDFGLAKLREGLDEPEAFSSGLNTISVELTRAGRVLGTASYMSPEQARGRPVDARSDIFSLGVVLYEMVTGQRPFRGATVTDILSSILRDAPAPAASLNPDVPLELQRITQKCLAKESRDRYQHADDIVVDLRNLHRLIDSQSAEVSSGSAPLAGPRASWMRRAGIVASAVALVAVAIVAVRWLSDQRPAPPVEAGVSSLAVLPIQNLQDAADPEQYGRILQELIITDLSGIDSLRVLSSQRLFDVQRQVGGADAARIDRELATEVARRAGATRMLTGSLSQLGSRWILTSQLVNLSDGAVVGSEKVDGADLYAMVDRLTSRMLDGLGLEATAHAGIGLAVNQKTSSSLDAYQQYLRGVDSLNRRDYDAAIAALKQALEIDPGFGQAGYKLAIAQWWADDAGQAQPTGDPAETLEKLLDADARLTAKERRLTEAFVPLLRYRTEQAQPLFRRLVRDYPDEKDAWYGLGEALYHVDGGIENVETAEAFLKVLELDPAFKLGVGHALQVYDNLGMHEAAVRLTRDLLEKNPDDPSWYQDWIRSVAYLAAERRDVELLDSAAAEALEDVSDAETRVELLMTIAGQYAWLGEIDKRERILLQAVDIAGEKRWEVLKLLGWVYDQRGDRREAERVWRRALKQKPRHPPVLADLSSLLRRERRYDEAIDIARSFVDDAPAELPAYGHWIEAAVEKGDVEQAREVLDRGLAQASSDADKLWLLQQAGWSLARVGNRILAEETFQRAAEIPGADQDADLQNAWGWNLFGLRRFEAAERTFRQALDISPDFGGALNGLRVTCIALDRHDESIAIGKSILQRFPRAYWSHRLHLDSLMKAGRLVDAERATEAGLQSVRTDADRMMLLVRGANSFRIVGEQETAARLIDRATALDVEIDEADFHAVRADLATDAGRYAEAERELRAAMGLFPSIDYALGVATLDLLRGRPAEAERQLRAILERGSGHRDIHRNMAYALIEQGRFAEALPFAETCVAMSPDRQVLEILAWILIAGEIDLDRGVEVARRALDAWSSPWEAKLARPYEPPAEHALGLVHLERGELDEAVRWLERAADARPGRLSIRTHLEQARRVG